MGKRSMLGRLSTFHKESYELKGILDKAEGDTPDDTEHEHTDKRSPIAQADKADNPISLGKECTTKTLMLTESIRQVMQVSFQDLNEDETHTKDCQRDVCEDIAMKSKGLESIRQVKQVSFQDLNEDERDYQRDDCKDIAMKSKGFRDDSSSCFEA
jgi:hypothetical protein